MYLQKSLHYCVSAFSDELEELSEFQRLHDMLPRKKPVFGDSEFLRYRELAEKYRRHPELVKRNLSFLDSSIDTLSEEKAKIFSKLLELGKKEISFKRQIDAFYLKRRNLEELADSLDINLSQA